ncbi:hypothetical protein CW304_01835 [Bacillus sp. UFRGS-B20]|nr:hypothetical protein CW304_01835 [Bacillus sp. UFRGS-B20]
MKHPTLFFYTLHDFFYPWKINLLICLLSCTILFFLSKIVSIINYYIHYQSQVYVHCIFIFFAFF